jgi:hypothetical protein
MLHNMHLSVRLSEAAHHISIDLNMEEPRQATLLDALLRSFGPNYCMVQDLDPPSRRVRLLPGGALDLLDHETPLSDEQEAPA